jgi:subtilisin family serine protease
MHILQKKYIKLGFNVLILIVFLSSFSVNLITGNFVKKENDILSTNNVTENYESNNNKKLIKGLYTDWYNELKEIDQNSNGLSDILEEKLNSEDSEENNKKNVQKQNSEHLISSEDFQNQISDNEIRIISKFPFENFNDEMILFQELGGIIKSYFTEALYGFSGHIEPDNLEEFTSILNENKIPFYIEEDTKVESKLYYISKNMNLRPYVWNTLGYNGDEDSSIAVLDTGIDESHQSFGTGYVSGDFNKKIVGWRDEVNSNSQPYDYNGHGSHCAGIISGNGFTANDSNGRTVSTSNLILDYTGSDVNAGTARIIVSRFNVTETGTIDINCEFDDYTPGSDDVDVYAYLYKGTTQVDSYSNLNDAWTSTLTYMPSNAELGEYSLEIDLKLNDNDGDTKVSDLDISFRGESHYPFNVDLLGSGNAWKGVANDTHLVGVKVLDQNGNGYTSDIIDGINWAITNKLTYHITTMSLSLGGPAGQATLINAVNNAVENGIVTVVAAGNDGVGGNNIGSPGDADNVITVAATNYWDNITSYSSEGGNSYTGVTIKPDLTAPGGSEYDLHSQSVDTNDYDAEGIYSDSYSNDLTPMQGTSMATPAVAGASNLLIEAMGGYSGWGYTADEAKSVKSLLLMTATETYPLLRETKDSTYSPILDRGGKDVHEGYGRINIDMAIEAYTKELQPDSYISDWIYHSQVDPFKKHGIGRHVNLIAGESYNFQLNVPASADFDLHIYKDSPTSIGEPIIVAKGINLNYGQDENIIFTPKESGKYYVIVKAVAGSGWTNLIFERFNGEYLFYEDFEDTLNKWDSITGLWHRTDETSSLSNNYFSPSNAMWFGQDSTRDYETGESERGSLITKPLNFTGLDDVYLEFQHRKETEDSNDYDISNISISVNGIDWLKVYENGSTIESWKKEKINLSSFAGNSSIQLNFMFDTVDEQYNNYTGWLLDDIVVYTNLKNYTKIDQHDYNWMDTTEGHTLNLNDDDFSQQYLPYSFKFYNQSYSAVNVSSNGYLSFYDDNPNYPSNTDFPSSFSECRYMIAPFWDDLDPTSGSGKVIAKNFTDHWVVEWRNIEHYNGNYTGTFQVILFRSGNIIFNYDEIKYVDGGYTCGLNYGFDTRFYNSITNLDNTIDDYSILFTPDNAFPQWLNPPQDQQIEFGNSFSYDVGAYDMVVITHYSIDDTTNFEIDSSGLIKNVNSLSVNTYPLEVKAYDNYDNYVEAEININVVDTTLPTWDEELKNHTIDYNVPFSYDVNASDLSGIDSYSVNNTTDFSVNKDGIITNATFLNSGTYYLKVTAADPYDNKIEEKIHITVNPSNSDEGNGDDSGDSGDDDDGTDDDQNDEDLLVSIPGYNFRIVLLLSVSGIGILTIFKAKKVINQ